MKAIFLSLLLLSAIPATAQGLSQSTLRNVDSRAPIDVDADRIDVVDQQSQAIFTGNVRARQANLTLEADRIKVSYTRPKSGGDPVINRLDADGNVRLSTPSERATSRFAIYDVDKRVLTLIGNVVLTQGQQGKVTGNRLTFDMASGRVSMDGKSSTGQPGSRVSGRFTVPDRK